MPPKIIPNATVRGTGEAGAPPGLNLNKMARKAESIDRALERALERAKTAELALDAIFACIALAHGLARACPGFDMEAFRAGVLERTQELWGVRKEGAPAPTIIIGILAAAEAGARSRGK